MRKRSFLSVRVVSGPFAECVHVTESTVWTEKFAHHTLEETIAHAWMRDSLSKPFGVRGGDWNALPFHFLLTLDKHCSIEAHLATVEDIMALLSPFEVDCHSKIIECARLMSLADGHIYGLIHKWTAPVAFSLLSLRLHEIQKAPIIVRRQVDKIPKFRIVFGGRVCDCCRSANKSATQLASKTKKTWILWVSRVSHRT